MSIATLLSQHHHVTAVDIIPEKVEMINNRKSPIQDDYIEKYLAEKDLDLTATLDAKAAFRCCWKQMVWRQEKTISLKDGMMPRKMQLSFRLKKMNKVPSRLKSVQLDITSTWSYNTSKWT